MHNKEQIIDRLKGLKKDIKEKPECFDTEYYQGYVKALMEVLDIDMPLELKGWFS